MDLTNKITKDAKNDEERVLKIFEWTYNNIKKQPETLAVIDDHVWHIIVRGYGVYDQYSDVFSTLCNYSGTDAYFANVFTKDKKQTIILSFVKINKKWRIFDPYRGVYFKNKYGKLADIEEVKNGNYHLERLSNGLRENINYKIFIENLPALTDFGLVRSNTQSPINRLLHKLKEVIS